MDNKNKGVFMKTLIHKYFISLLWVCLVGPASTTFAIMTDASDRVLKLDNTADLKNERVQLPVSWQLTRTRFLSSGSTNQTESYREFWELELHSDGLAYLVSPRGKAVIRNAIDTSIIQ